MYTLFVATLISGHVSESQWKTFDRFEECWEVAQTISHNRSYISARCVLVEKPNSESKNTQPKNEEKNER